MSLSLWEKLASIPDLLRARVVFRGADAGLRVHVAGPLVVRNEGTLRVEDRAVFLTGVVPTELVCAPGAELVIAESAVLNYGCSLRAAQRVHVGRRCMLGSMVRIRDDDGLRRAPVHVGDDVWIAHAAIVEPGVTIGDGAVVAAGSVVTVDVPAGMMAVGNPARIVPLGLARGTREPPDAPRKSFA